MPFFQGSTNLVIFIIGNLRDYNQSSVHFIAASRILCYHYFMRKGINSGGMASLSLAMTNQDKAL